jgi:hypothetical protein
MLAPAMHRLQHGKETRIAGVQLCNTDSLLLPCHSLYFADVTQSMLIYASSQICVCEALTSCGAKRVQAVLTELCKIV